MAITLSSLAEETLNRQERAIVRGIYRASQLNEAVMQLDKITNLYSTDELVKNEMLSVEKKAHYLKLKQYLLNSISQALISTKVPAIAPAKKNVLLAQDVV